MVTTIIYYTKYELWIEYKRQPSQNNNYNTNDGQPQHTRDHHSHSWTTDDYNETTTAVETVTIITISSSHQPLSPSSSPSQRLGQLSQQMLNSDFHRNNNNNKNNNNNLPL